MTSYKIIKQYIQTKSSYTKLSNEYIFSYVKIICIQ